MTARHFFVAAATILLWVERSPAPIREATPEPTAKPKAQGTAKPKSNENFERSTSSRQKEAAQSNRRPFQIPQSQMTASATSVHPGNDPRKAIDGNPQSFWTTPWNLFGSLITLPQSITLNLGGMYDVIQLRYLPRQDIWENGNITTYKIYASKDGAGFTQIATGSWTDDHTEKSVTFAPARASYIRLEAVAGHGGHAIAAELNVTAIR